MTARPDRLFRGYVFDLDGTVCLGDAVLPTAGRLAGDPGRALVIRGDDRAGGGAPRRSEVGHLDARTLSDEIRASLARWKPSVAGRRS